MMLKSLFFLIGFVALALSAPTEAPLDVDATEGGVSEAPMEDGPLETEAPLTEEGDLEPEASTEGSVELAGDEAPAGEATESPVSDAADEPSGEDAAPPTELPEEDRKAKLEARRAEKKKAQEEEAAKEPEEPVEAVIPAEEPVAAAVIDDEVIEDASLEAPAAAESSLLKRAGGLHHHEDGKEHKDGKLRLQFDAGVPDLCKESNKICEINEACAVVKESEDKLSPICIVKVSHHHPKLALSAAENEVSKVQRHLKKVQEELQKAKDAANAEDAAPVDVTQAPEAK